MFLVVLGMEPRFCVLGRKVAACNKRNNICTWEAECEPEGVTPKSLCLPVLLGTQ